MTVRGTAALVSLLALVGCEKASKISTGSLSGTAVYAGQSDSSGISITAGGYSATTDASGNYSFAALPVGTYSVMAVAPRSAERTIAVTATVNSGANTAPSITFSPMQTLAGQVTFMGKAVQGASASLDGGASVTTDANGIYSFPSAGAGAHALSFSSSGMSDAIPEVLYSTASGPSVTAAFSGQIYGLEPFDVQGARRVASVNLKVPSRSMVYPAILSPDGLLYAYGTTNDVGLANLYVGSTSGGTPVLVAGNARNDQAGISWPRWSPGSNFLAFLRQNPTTGRFDLCAVSIGAGPTVGPVKVLTSNFVTTTDWTFSPQTSAALPSIYFSEADSAAFGGATLREANTDGGPLNEWQGIISYIVSQKQKRVVIRLGGPVATPNHRLISVAATGASVGTTAATYESQGATNFTFSFNAFNADESRFAYFLSGLTGFKTAATGSASTFTFADPAFVSCPVQFNAAGDRVMWVRCATTCPTVSRVATGTSPETVSPTNLFICPQVTSDNRVWIVEGSTLRVGLAPLDNLAAGTPFVDTLPSDFGALRQTPSAFVFTRGSSSSPTFWAITLSGAAATQFDSAPDGGSLFSFAPSGSGGFYRKRELLNGESFADALYWVGFPGAAPATAKVVSRFISLSFSPANQSKALVWKDEGSFQTVTSVDMATGATKPLLRSVILGFPTPFLQEIGTPGSTTPKFIGIRTNSPMPYEFQDGIYVADP